MASSNNSVCENLQVKILDESDNLAAFDCSKDDTMGLNEFIHEEALQFQKENLGVTHLFYYENHIVGFATLSMCQIEVKDTPLLLPFPVTIKFYPALQIGRLAIDNNYRKCNVGRRICLWCFSRATQLAHDVGCKLIVVLTKGNPVEFYQKCGFRVIPKDIDKHRKWLFIPLLPLIISVRWKCPECGFYQAPLVPNGPYVGNSFGTGTCQKCGKQVKFIRDSNLVAPKES